MDIITLYPSAYFVKMREVVSRVVSRCVKITSSFFMFFFISICWFFIFLVGFHGCWLVFMYFLCFFHGRMFVVHTPQQLSMVFVN